MNHLLRYIPRPGKSAGARIVVPYGSSSDGDKPGMAHFVEHMIFKGTDKIPLAEFTLRSERLGYFNAYTDYQRTVYHVRCLHRNIKESAKLLLDMTSNAAFPEAEVEKEREVICQEIATWHATPWNSFYMRALTSLLGEYLGHFQGGSEESVRAITADDLRRWHGGAAKDDAVLVIPTDTELPTLPARFLRDRDVRNFVKPQWDYSPVDFSHSTKQAIIGLFSKGVYAVDDAERFFPGDVAAEILGGGRQSKLFRRLRDDLGLCYHTTAQNSSYETWGYCGALCQLAPARIEEAECAMREQMQLVADGCFTNEEFEIAKERVALGYALHYEGDSGYLRLADMIFGGLPSWWDRPDAAEVLVAGIENLSRDAVMQAAVHAWGPSASIKRVRMLPE